MSKQKLPLGAVSFAAVGGEIEFRKPIPQTKALSGPTPERTHQSLAISIEQARALLGILPTNLQAAIEEAEIQRGEANAKRLAQLREEQARLQSGGV